MRRLLPPTSPEIWGPPLWISLHLLASGYPDDPTPPVRRHCASFLEALAWMLPCESCGYHFRDFLHAYQGGLALVVSCRPELVRFLVAAHNAVSRHTRPEALPWTVDQAEQSYSTPIHAVADVDPPVQWVGSSILVRSMKRNSCGCSKAATPSAGGLMNI